MAAPQNAKTDSDGLRYYEWDGEKYPSVTTLRRIVGVPFSLVNWMQANVMNAVIEDPTLAEVRQVPTRGKGKTRDEKPAEVRKRIRAAADAERDQSADRGSRVHEAAEKRVPVSRAEPDVAPFLAQFYDFLEVSNAKVLSQEGQVFNLRLGYAGSYDLIVQLPDGRIVVVDIKTGKNIYADHALQLMGYGLGEFVGWNDRKDMAATQLLQGAHALAVLHLTEDGWEFVELNVTTELRQAFEAMCLLAHWMERYDSNIEALTQGVMKSE